MVRLTKIYTRTGDDGTTALGDGARVTKLHPRIRAYGSADELGAVIGLAARAADAPMRQALRRIQNDLFDLGADLAVPARDDESGRLRIVPEQVTRLEREIDAMNEGLKPLDSFVLSGGTEAGAQLHLARCVARRCELEALALATSERVNADALRYLNRLSDWLFVAARRANQDGGEEILWRPGGER